MRVDRGFLMSFYLSLTLAGACLGYVALATHPSEVWLLAGPVCLVLLVAYCLEGRWSLNHFWATVVGLVMAATAGVWFANFFVHLSSYETDTITWPILLLPHMGFWLVLLTLAKLFRPKSTGDFWSLHLMAFSGVALAASLDSDFFLSFLLFAYLGCVLWSLACFYLYREDTLASRSRSAKRDTAVPAANDRAAIATAYLPWRWLGLLQASRRALLILAVVVVFYLLTPRHTASSWEESLFRSASLQSGLGDSLIDLNRTGTIRTSSAVAFEVKAEFDDGRAIVDLDSLQRWRGLVLNHYESGRWSSTPIRYAVPAKARKTPPGLLMPSPEHKSGVLPDYGPQQFFLTFSFPGPLLRLPVVAEPADLFPSKAAPVVFYGQDRSAHSALRHTDGELRVAPEIRSRRECNSYRQVMAPVREPAVSLPVDPAIDYNRSYCRLPPLPELTPWVNKVLEAMVEQGRLAPGDIQRDGNASLLPSHHEKVARALEVYLSSSGNYMYSLHLPRQDRTLDPIVDFLCNVKQGHCERFASGLTVMLRSQGIPARMIAGFRGAEHKGNGQYHIRHNHSHAWVEVLIERPGADGRPERRWLTLDPTANEDAGEESLTGFARWWRGFSTRGGNLWRNYVVDYTAEQQDLVLSDFYSRFSFRSLFSDSGGGSRFTAILVVTLLGFPLLYLTCRAWRRRRRGNSDAETAGGVYVAFYAAWLAVIARRLGLEPRRGQTAMEFAQDLGNRLQGVPQAAGIANLPAVLASLYYRVRYAARPLSAVEQHNVESDIRDFDLALATLADDLPRFSELPA